MSMLIRFNRSAKFLVLTTLLLLLVSTSLAGQITRRRGVVGGVSIDTNGVLSQPVEVEMKNLQRLRQAALQEIPAALDEYTDMRLVSLRGLEAAIAKHRKDLTKLPDAIRYMAGLQRVKYVFLDPAKNDVILAGPGEGWKIDKFGNAVGITTGRPTLTLEDFIVALRAGESSNETGISCSIDPRVEGLKRLETYFDSKHTMGNPQQTIKNIEKILGPQDIRITGVPASSHFARSLVAADFRMKRIAMGLEPAPIPRMPSFLSLLSKSRSAKSLLPRWWLAPKYEPLRRDKEGLAWELRGQGVQCQTEMDFLTASGEIKRGVGANKIATRWANNFNTKFEQLANEDSVFGTIRNTIDLAVIGALLAKEDMLLQVKLELPYLMQKETLQQYPIPKTVSTKANFVKRSGKFFISASGGVQIYPWQIAAKSEVAESMAKKQANVIAAAAKRSNWWWNGSQK